MHLGFSVTTPFFVSAEDIPQSGITKALDISVLQKLPGSETHFSL